MKMNFQWTQSAQFYNRVERINLHGLHFQHIRLCQRRAWMYLHKINFAQWNGRVATGAALHQTSYQRDRTTVGLIGLSPDRIDWKRRVVYENKGTGGAVEPVNDQVAFYGVMLSIADGIEWQGEVHVLSSRRHRTVKLDQQRLDRLWESSLALEQLSEQSNVPDAAKIALCDSCSFVTFCGHD